MYILIRTMSCYYSLKQSYSGLVCVSIWYEVEVNNGIADGYDSVLDFISIDNDSTGTGFPELMTRTDYFERFEYYRYMYTMS